MTDPGVPGVPGMVVDGMPGPPGIVVEGVPGGARHESVRSSRGRGNGAAQRRRFPILQLGRSGHAPAAAMAAASNASGCSKSISNCEPLSSKTSLRGATSTFPVATVAGSATV